MLAMDRCRGKFAGEECCTDLNKCEEGEGNCKTDEGCLGNLVCGNFNCDYSIGFKNDYACCRKPVD